MTRHSPYSPIYRHKPGSRRRCVSVCACATLALTVAGLAPAARVMAAPVNATSPLVKAPRPLYQAVALVSSGAVWFDAGPVFFEPFRGGRMRLGPARQQVFTQGSVTSSASALATGGGQTRSAEEERPRLLAGIPPAPFQSIRYPPLFARAGCRGWEPGGTKVLAGDDLVAAGKCFWDDRFSRQPLFVRNLHGRRWHVLRWLTGEYEPVLAAEGSLLAIGVQHSLAQMDVSILDLRGDRLRAHFTLPDGYLSFASRDRLVLSSPVLHEPDGVCFPLTEPCQPYRVALYSTRGRHIAELGTLPEPPLVSDMHLLIDEENSGTREYQTLSVRDLAGGRSGEAPSDTRKRIIGFNSPARALVALAFRWPALAVIETTSAPLLPSEITCWSGEYKPAGNPFLQIFDLARHEPFLPAPPIVPRAAKRTSHKLRPPTAAARACCVGSMRRDDLGTRPTPSAQQTVAQALRRARLDRRAASLSVLSGAGGCGRGPLRVPWLSESSVRSSSLIPVAKRSAIDSHVSSLPLTVLPLTVREVGRRRSAAQLPPAPAPGAAGTASPHRRPRPASPLGVARLAAIAVRRNTGNVQASPSSGGHHTHGSSSSSATASSCVTPALAESWQESRAPRLPEGRIRPARRQVRPNLLAHCAQVALSPQPLWASAVNTSGAPGSSGP